MDSCRQTSEAAAANPSGHEVVLSVSSGATGMDVYQPPFDTRMVSKTSGSKSKLKTRVVEGEGNDGTRRRSMPGKFTSNCSAPSNKSST